VKSHALPSLLECPTSFKTISLKCISPALGVQVDILDLYPRKNPRTGKTYGSNAAAWWGYQFRLPFATGTSGAILLGSTQPVSMGC
jgi:hypothetical protein